MHQSVDDHAVYLVQIIPMKQLIFGLLLLVFISCKSQSPRDVVGNWHCDSTAVTVRKQTGFLKYQFFRGKLNATLVIGNDKKASGQLGAFKFENRVLVVNGGNPERTGVAYKIKLGSVNHLFVGDSSETIEVELWLLNAAGDSLRVEMRQSSTGDQFPMGEIVLVKG